MTFAECHGEGTEILTPKGWVNFKDIDTNTEVIQYDLETNTMTPVLPIPSSTCKPLADNTPATKAAV
jgi:hypothetical protein